MGQRDSDGVSLLDLIGPENGFSYAAATNIGFHPTVQNNQSTEPESVSGYGVGITYYAFAVNYGERGIIIGHSGCSKVSGDNNDFTWVDPSKEPSRPDRIAIINKEPYCWCNVDKYKSPDGHSQNISAPWIYYAYTTQDNNGENECEEHCARWCANALMGPETKNPFAGNTVQTMKQNLKFRRAMLDGITLSGGACVPNRIHIIWGDAEPEAIEENYADTTIYGGDIRTPVDVIPRIGATFKGWRFGPPLPE